MTDGYGRVLDICADLAGVDDIQHLRMLLANSMANILGAKAVALMGLNDTQDSCVPLASWPPDLKLPAWNLLSVERDNDPVIWALGLPETVHETSTRSPLIASLKVMLGFCGEDTQLVVVPARFAANRFAEMVFFAAVAADGLRQPMVGAIAKFARFSARTNHICRRFHESRAAVDMLSRSMRNADRRETRLRQMITASLAEILVGSSREMGEFRENLVTLAASAGPVLIEGEPGTGKELSARILHSLSERRDKPFVHVRVADLIYPEHQLFGSSDGHPDEAVHSHSWNLLARAHGGTLLLDGVAGLPIALQAKLLAAYEQKTLLLPGSSQTTPADFRLIVSSATPVDALAARQGLHIRLLDRQFIKHLRLPPLSERRGDIPELVGHFLRSTARLYATEESLLSVEAMQTLGEHDYPGNVRQLQRLLLEAAWLVGPGKTIPGRHIRHLLDTSVASTEISKPGLREACDTYERDLIRRCLVSKGGNRSRVALELRIPLRTLADKLKKHGLERISYEIEVDGISRGLHGPVVVGAELPGGSG